MTNATFANKIGYTDVYPYEVIRHITPKTIENRAMNSVLAPEFKPDIQPGGFAGHCTNNTEQQQKWLFSTDESARVIRIRLHKDGGWYHKGSRFQLGDKPRRFHDYNF